MKYKYRILLALFLISLASSLIMSLVPVSEICNIGEGCEIVQHSSYASTLGIKNNYIGVGIFLAMSLLIFSHIKNPTKNKKNIIHTSVIIGSIVALYFIYLQRFILHAYCKYCLVVDFSILIALIVVFFDWNK